jgi:hypothetical protein
VTAQTYLLNTDSACDRPETMTVAQAHTVMQQHRHAAPNCALRRAALALLVAQGHYRLAS